MIEISESNGEEFPSLHIAIWMRTAQEMGVFPKDSMAMWASVLFILVIAVSVVSGRQPAVDAFHELLVLLVRMLVESLVMNLTCLTCEWHRTTCTWL